METFFSKHYDTLMGILEKKGFTAIREVLLKEAEGKVLEIGSGTGLNFPYYRNSGRVTAVEPNEVMMSKSLRRAAVSVVPIEVVHGDAEKLPFEDNSFDTVVGTLVLCTIPNPEKALKEIRRVCKSGGTVLFFEHIRLNNRLWGKLQDWLTPAWKHLCDGCHLNRNSVDMIQHTGLKVIRIHRYYRNIFVTIKAINVKNENNLHITVK